MEVHSEVVENAKSLAPELSHTFNSIYQLHKLINHNIHYCFEPIHIYHIIYLSNATCIWKTETKPELWLNSSYSTDSVSISATIITVKL